MAGDIDREGVEKAYGRWAPVYDLVFGKVFDHGRQSTIAEADKIGGRVLDVGVGTGLSLSEYSRSTKLCGVDISEPMLRRALKRVRTLGRRASDAALSLETLGDVHVKVRGLESAVVVVGGGLGGSTRGDCEGEERTHVLRTEYVVPGPALRQIQCGVT